MGVSCSSRSFRPIHSISGDLNWSTGILTSLGLLLEVFSDGRNKAIGPQVPPDLWGIGSIIVAVAADSFSRGCCYLCSKTHDRKGCLIADVCCGACEGLIFARG